MTAQPGFAPHVATLGQGARPVLALHCTLAFGGAWAGLAAQLGDDLTLIAPDMPSHGRSADWDGISSFPQTVLAMAAALLEGRQMDIIGHSFGAATALRLALDHPERVRSLTLIEPVLFGVAQADAPDTVAAHDAQASAFHAAFESGDNTAAARAFNRMWSDGPAWDDLPDRTRAAMVRAIPVVPDTFGFVYDRDGWLLGGDGLRTLSTPTLLLRGENALPAIAAIIDGLHRRLPNAAAAVISGAGHMAPITHPKATADLIRPFLSDH